MPSYRLISAGIILLLYFIFAGVILARIFSDGGVNDTAWQQVIVVLNAVGAIATTAAGVLLGVDIQHASTQQALRKADDLDGQLMASRATAAEALDYLEGADPTTGGDRGVTAARATLLGGLAPRPAA